MSRNSNRIASLCFSSSFITCQGGGEGQKKCVSQQQSCGKFSEMEKTTHEALESKNGMRGDRCYRRLRFLS